jgi:predicted flavoprotein YhiN
MLYGFKKSKPKKLVLKSYDFDIPKRLWNSLVLAIGVPLQLEWAHMTKEQLVALAEALTNGMYEVNGKSTFKEEFVTAGGIKLKEVSFKDCQSKKHLGLYFAGEVLNIDAITGGFNFQNAWTTAFLAAQGMVAQAKAFEN